MNARINNSVTVGFTKDTLEILKSWVVSTVNPDPLRNNPRDGTHTILRVVVGTERGDCDRHMDDERE